MRKINETYALARKIDDILNTFMEDNPLTGESALDWLLLIRTINTSTQIMTDAVEEFVESYDRF